MAHVKQGETVGHQYAWHGQRKRGWPRFDQTLSHRLCMHRFWWPGNLAENLICVVAIQNLVKCMLYDSVELKVYFPSFCDQSDTTLSNRLF